MSSKIQGAIKTIDPSKQRYKVLDEEERVIEGYFTTTDVDRIGDVSLPSAFVKTLENYMKNPVLTFMHDIRQVIGKVLDYKIDENGVWIKAQIAKGVQYIDDVWTLVKQGIIKGFSYGYSVKDEEPEVRDGLKVNVLKEVDVYEIAVVTIPMNGNALFTLTGNAVKSVSLNLGEISTPEEKGEKGTSVEADAKEQETKEGEDMEIKYVVLDVEEFSKKLCEAVKGGISIPQIDAKVFAKEFIEALKEDKDTIKGLFVEEQKVIEKEEEKQAEEDDTAELVTTITELKEALTGMVKLFKKEE